MLGAWWKLGRGVSEAWFRARVGTAMTSNSDDRAEAYEGPVQCGKAVFWMVLSTSVLEAAHAGRGLEAGEGLQPEAAGTCRSLWFPSSTCATASGKL